MKTTRFLVLASLLGFATSLPLAGQGPGRGGRGPGGGGGHGGGGPGGFQEAIHTLFDNHTQIRRSVELTATGYKSRTVSDNPEIARTLQKHVREMRERLGSGRMVRRWDPAFAELVEHYQEIDHEFKEVDGGVEMIASGRTPEAIKVAQNHARIVSGFVEKGPAQMHEKHAPALGEPAPADAASTPAPAAPDAPADADGPHNSQPPQENQGPQESPPATPTDPDPCHDRKTCAACASHHDKSCEACSDSDTTACQTSPSGATKAGGACGSGCGTKACGTCSASGTKARGACSGTNGKNTGSPTPATGCHSTKKAAGNAGPHCRKAGHHDTSRTTPAPAR